MYKGGLTSADLQSSTLYSHLNNQVKIKATNGFGSARTNPNPKPTGVKLNSFRGGPVKATIGAFENIDKQKPVQKNII